MDGGEPDLDPILALLERRGPDGTHRWADGPIALGHTSLATTPEALAEVLPLAEPDSGCTITADARLDNREQLIAALGLGGETRTIGDGELILRAYLRWGEECPTHLLGDFAFAIWDPRATRLFCARDHMGMRQLIYHYAPGRLFAFATEAEALVAHAGVPRRINEARIADFLDDLEGIDFTSTFFEEVLRLPPAHTLTVDFSGLSLRRYWTLSAGPELKLDSDEAYAEAFLNVFTEAVRCRLRSAGPVGSMLSGGIDSGSVAAIAARLLAAERRGPLQTFSAVGTDRESCVETRAIYAAAKLPGLNAHFVDHARLGNLCDELIGLSDGAEPFDSHMTLIRNVYLAAHQANIKVILDGAAGDLILAPRNSIARWLRRGQIINALREMRGEARFWGPTWPKCQSLIKAAWAAFVPHPIRKLRRWVMWRIEDQRIGADSLIAREFAAKINLNERRRTFRRHLPVGGASDAEQRAQSIRHPHLAAGRERYDRVASAVAIEPRDPFLDIRIVQFCLTLPWQQLQVDGWPKIVLRRAMRDRLPPTIIWRRGKQHLGWDFTQALFRGWDGWAEVLSGGEAMIGRFATRIATDDGNEQSGKALDNEDEFKLFFLLRWLQRQARHGHSANLK